MLLLKKFPVLLTLIILQGCVSNIDTAQDCNQLIGLQTKAAKGDIHSQVTLAELYSSGTCVKQDLKESRKWFARAAKNGGPLPKYALANMYHDGAGGVKDNKKAVEWYEKAGQQGLSDAYSALSLMYYYADGVDRNLDLAKKYSNLAKSTNDGEMKFHAARMYETGNGVMKNIKWATVWYRASCIKGFTPSCNKFIQLTNKSSCASQF